MNTIITNNTDMEDKSMENMNMVQQQDAQGEVETVMMADAGVALNSKFDSDGVSIAPLTDPMSLYIPKEEQAVGFEMSEDLSKGFEITCGDSSN